MFFQVLSPPLANIILSSNEFIPTPKFLAKEEFMAHAQLISLASSLRIDSGKRFLTLKLKDLENYISSRAKRGNMLPQGYRKVDNMIEEVGTAPPVSEV